MKLATALSVLLATAAFAQGEAKRHAAAVIVGAVTDSALRPIAGAEVAIAGSSVHISTDALGRFRIINVPAGRFVLTARSIGRAPAASLVEIGANGTTMTEPFDLSYLPPPNHIATIEIYSQSGDVPPILAWTAAG